MGEVAAVVDHRRVELSPEAIDLVSRQHGVVASSQLREFGYTNVQIHRLRRSDGWRSPTTRVLVRAGSADTAARRLMTAALDVGADAAVSHLTGGSWWGLGGCRRWPAHVTTTRGCGQRPTLAVVHEVRRLPPEWSTTFRGVPVVRPELLALQLHAVLHPARADRLIDQLWSARLLSGPSIAAFLADMGERGRNGTAGLRRYLDARPADYVPPASGLEHRFAELAAGLGPAGRFRRQVDVGGTRWNGRVDFRHQTLPLIVEIQSERYHGSLTDRDADRERIDRLVADGFTVVEVADTEVWSRPSPVLGRLGQALDDLRDPASVPRAFRLEKPSRDRTG